MKEIIIIGQGKLAQAFFNHFNDYSDISLRKYKQGISTTRDSIYLHLGSGRQYKESLNSALKSNSYFVQAATEKNCKMPPPKEGSLVYIEAPNLDINIIKLFILLKNAKNLFNDEAVSICESHQKEKQSLPGTALKLCDHLNLPKESVISIRNPAVQKKLGISNLKQHAYHKIQIGDEDSGISIETKVEGSLSYVKGFAKISEYIPGLQHGHYDIDDLLDI